VIRILIIEVIVRFKKFLNYFLLGGYMYIVNEKIRRRVGIKETIVEKKGGKLKVKTRYFYIKARELDDFSKILDLTVNMMKRQLERKWEVCITDMLLIRCFNRDGSEVEVFYEISEVE